ncbi:PPC domain-containing DNA-binding protein [Megalodesulfovibrio paquesii]
MQAAEGRLGRVFVLRLEDGDRIPDIIEAFAAERGLSRALCALLGGVGSGSLVVGPQDGTAAIITPLLKALGNVHEVAALGTLFPDAEGAPRLHMHLAAGRGDETVVGCTRRGVDIWKLAEVVLLELVDVPMTRRVDPAFGFEVLCRD